MRFTRWLLILILPVSLWLCKETLEPESDGTQVKDVDDYMLFTRAKGGLILREKPERGAPKVAIVPDGRKVWVRKVTLKKEVIDGRENVWAWIEYYPPDGDKMSGWGFHGFLEEDKNPEIGPGFRSGCLGGGCFLCGANVFDPGGRFIMSYSCEDPPYFGKWMLDGSRLLACAGKNCDLKKTEDLFIFEKQGSSIVRKHHEDSEDLGAMSTWEPHGWKE